jgi:hypothetical protein
MSTPDRPASYRCSCGITMSAPADKCLHWPRSAAEAATDIGADDDPDWIARGSYARLLSWLFFIGLVASGALYLAVRL